MGHWPLAGTGLMEVAPLSLVVPLLHRVSSTAFALHEFAALHGILLPKSSVSVPPVRVSGQTPDALAFLMNGALCSGRRHPQVRSGVSLSYFALDVFSEAHRYMASD